jgi:hypothetical protein
MKPSKAKEKKANCLKHRQAQYFKALDGLMEGKLPPEYVSKRFGKLKEIKGK